LILGEIRNKATSFADLSLIYGSPKDDSLKIRSFSQGKILQMPGRTIPVDASGQYSDTSIRISNMVTVSSWIIILARNHNNLAERLTVLNPSWNDEKTYQEARRINIAIIQSILLSNEINQDVFGQFTKKDYNPDIDPSLTVELRGASTFNHYLVPSAFRFINTNGVLTDVLQSDITKRADVLDQYFDDSVRGALNQSIFSNLYSDEVGLSFIYRFTCA
jgi:peroxidase